MHKNRTSKKMHRSAQKGNTVPFVQSRARLHCFTSFAESPPGFVEDTMTFLAYGQETCPSTNRLHWQGFVHWKDGKTVAASGKALGNAHSEIIRGTIEDNVRYCAKDGHYTEFGVRPCQGKRTDLIEVVEAIKAKTLSSDTVAMDNPTLYHQYGRTLEKVQDLSRRSLYRTEMTTATWIYGPTGAGKSHEAFKDFTPSTHYVWRDDKGWWENYVGQPTVIMNDFRGEIPFNQLLQLIDKWPFYVPQRGRPPMPFVSKHIIITSSLHPADVYCNLKSGDDLSQLLRRITITEIAPPRPPPGGALH